MAVAALAGAALAAAFPPLGWWWLAPLAVAGLTLACAQATLRTAALVGAAFGITFFGLLLPWMRVIGLDAWVLLTVFCALYLAALGAATSLVMRLPGWPLWVAAVWSLQEAVRATVPLGGFPWGRLAFSQSDSPVTGLAAVAGAPAITFAVALSGALIAWAGQRLRHRRRTWPVAAAVAGAAAWLLAGLAVPLPTQGSPVVVAVVQGSVPGAGMDAFGRAETVLRNHVTATTELAARVRGGAVPQPQLVVWPENASDLDPFTNPEARTLIDDAVDAIGVPTLVGVVRESPDGRGRLNTGVVWDPVTGPGEQYVKRHPVPFGETVPWRGLLSSVVSRLDRIPQDVLAGSRPGVLTLGPATVGDVICFEVAYDSLVRDVVTGGADLLTVQTNNATYARSGQVEQQLAMSRLRAVEHGRSVLVAATSGISAIIAPNGDVIAQAPELQQRSLVATVPLRSSLTLADRLGAWPERALAAAGAMAVLYAAGSALRRRRRVLPQPVPGGSPTGPDAVAVSVAEERT